MHPGFLLLLVVKAERFCTVDLLFSASNLDLDYLLGLYGSLVFSEPQGDFCLFVFKRFILLQKARFWPSDRFQFL